MKICVKCKWEMRCEKTGLGARFGNAHVYPGDMYECPQCGVQIIVSVSAPTFDPNHSIETVQMESK